MAQPPIDMMDVVLPFIKNNKEYVVSNDTEGNVYYKLSGTKTEAAFYFHIGKKKAMTTTDLYWISYSPSSKSSFDATNRWNSIATIKANLEFWLTLIKHHRSHFEDVVLESNPIPEPIQEPVMEPETTNEEIEYSTDEIIQLIHDKHQKGTFRLITFLKTHQVKITTGQPEIIMQILRDEKFIDEKEQSVPGDFSIVVRYHFTETIKEHGSWSNYLEHKKFEKERERRRQERKDFIEEKTLDKLGYDEQQRPLDKEVKETTIDRNVFGATYSAIQIGIWIGGALLTLASVLSALLK